MQSNTEFKNAYSKLNPQQKLAVDTLNGPVLVIAGPGTGKTQILTLRIANILLNTDADPGSILALTFTESGVKAMRERLAQFIGATAYYVNITTFHSFASEIIQTNPDYFLISREHKIASDLDKLSIIQTILDKNAHDFVYLRPQGDPYFYTSYIIKTIQDLKREGVTYESYVELIKNNAKRIEEIKSVKAKAKELNELKDLEKQIELEQLYKNYQQQLIANKMYDFEDMINKVNEMFQKEQTLLQTYQEKYQYILVDEFQDTNNAQYKILKNLTDYWGETADIFAVGDDDQSIYRFQGASLENIINFTSDFPTSTIITLVNNYRSTQQILDASRELINNNKASISSIIKGINKNLTTNTTKESTIQYYNFSSSITETQFIAQKIQEIIKQGEDPNEIAVIFRHNSDSKDIANSLAKLGVLYNLEGGENILNDPIVFNFIDLFTVILKAKSNDEELDLFNLFSQEYLQFDYLDNLKLARMAGKTKKSIYQIVCEKDFIKNKDITNSEKYITLITQQIPKWQKLDCESIFTETFEKILEESGYLSYLLNRNDSIESINKINSLYNEVKKWVNNNNNFKIADFIKNIEVMKKNNLKISETDFDITSNTVTLCTAHKSKGLEFKHVFIYGFSDKKWGNNTSRELIKLPEGIVQQNTKNNDQETKNEDERRLFYVALTRSKEFIYITNANKYFSEWGEKQAEKSMFYFDLPQKNIQNISIEEIETTDFVKNALQQIFVYEDKNATQEENILLTELVKNYRLSVTGLNTYLECAYKFKLNTLLKTPRSKSPYLSFGSAVHYALEMFYKKFIQLNKAPELEYLLKSFEEGINKEILTDQDKKILTRKGNAVLKAYYTIHKNNFTKPEYLERNFGYGLGRVLIEDVELAGKVDRIEVLRKEGDTTYVKVVDYKTGKPKTRNEIEGKTQNSDGAYKRQLVFYKLLCDLDKTFKYKAELFELDFVGEEKASKPKKEIFEISQQEVEDLKQIILETMKKIRNLEFNKTTDYTICKKCDYNKHCWPNGIPVLNFKQTQLDFSK